MHEGLKNRPVEEQQAQAQPGTQESFCSSFSAHRSSLHPQAAFHLVAVEAVAALAHASLPTVAAVSIVPPSCFLRGLHCFLIAVEAAATVVPQALAAFDALPLSLGASKAIPASV